mmetsp:Transcript_21964/g.54939  ORF Transcript_21964/g.54939 Transcript_21964/m.54939 type:complete len:353 (-) Transcript_21964:1058-2116(-)
MRSAAASSAEPSSPPPRRFATKGSARHSACLLALATASISAAAARRFAASASRLAASSARRARAAAAAFAASAPRPASERNSSNSRVAFPAFCCRSDHSPVLFFAWLRPHTFHTAKLSTRSLSSTDNNSFANRWRNAMLPRVARHTAAQTQPPTGSGPSSASKPLKAFTKRILIFLGIAEVSASAASRMRAVFFSSASARSVSLFPRMAGKPSPNGCTASSGNRKSAARICGPAAGNCRSNGGASATVAVGVALSLSFPWVALFPSRCPASFCFSRIAGPSADGSSESSAGQARRCSEATPKALKTCAAQWSKPVRSRKLASKSFRTRACCGGVAAEPKSMPKSDLRNAAAS